MLIGYLKSVNSAGIL